MNHHPEKTFTIRTGNRIAQCVFTKKYNVEFQKVSDMLGITEQAERFGLIGGITKVTKLDGSDSENNENKMLILPKKKGLLKLIGIN